MNANELRIGNIITHDDYSSDVFTVLTIEKDSGTYYIHSKGGKNGYWDNNIKLINPISLTEEWMMKFGFSKNFRIEVDLYRRIPVWSYCSFSITIWENGKLFYDWLGGNIEIKYVHQLQNLYFALMGEELTIKETINVKHQKQ